jgi:hypothetical protein
MTVLLARNVRKAAGPAGRVPAQLLPDNEAFQRALSHRSTMTLGVAGGSSFSFDQQDPPE